MRRILRMCMLMGALAPVAATAQSSSTTRTSPLKTGISEFDAERLDQAKATLLPLAKAGDAEAMF